MMSFSLFLLHIALLGGNLPVVVESQRSCRVWDCISVVASERVLYSWGDSLYVVVVVVVVVVVGSSSVMVDF